MAVALKEPRTVHAPPPAAQTEGELLRTLIALQRFVQDLPEKLTKREGIVVGPGMGMFLRTWSSVASRVVLRTRLRVGGVSKWGPSVTLTTASNRTEENRVESLAGFDGAFVEHMELVYDAGATIGDRGRTYVVFGLCDFHGVRAFSEEHVVATLGNGYQFDGHNVKLGENVEPGPGGGEGFRSNRILAQDVAGNAAASARTFALAATNTLRKVTGFVFYYHADSTAITRLMNVLIRALGGALPTGFTAGTNETIWGFSANLDLSANEEGVAYAQSVDGKDGLSVRVDVGARSTENAAALPNPFPLYVLEGDRTEIFVDIASGQAGDDFSLYVFTEEWLVPS